MSVPREDGLMIMMMMMLLIVAIMINGDDDGDDENDSHIFQNNDQVCGDDALQFPSV